MNARRWRRKHNVIRDGIGRSSGDFNHVTRLDHRQHRVNFRNYALEIRETVSNLRNHDDRDSDRSQILLIRQARVRGDQHLETGVQSCAQKDAVS